MDHFKVSERGFSLKLDGDLDMRFYTHTGIPVSERLEKASYNDLKDLFVEHTDFSDRFIEKVVKELAVVKRKTPFHTTHQFRDRAKSFGINDKKLAVIFQAFRIKVNDELDQLDRFLETFVPYLTSG